MHLWLGKSIVSGHSKPSRVSTQGSGTRPSVCFPLLIEDSYLRETKSTTSTSISIASYNKWGYAQSTIWCANVQHKAYFCMQQQKGETTICRPIQPTCCQIRECGCGPKPIL